VAETPAAAPSEAAAPAAAPAVVKAESGLSKLELARRQGAFKG